VSDEALLQRTIAAVDGHYEIEAEIGRGGMAVVYRARDTRLRRKVALKVLPPDLAFRDEVKRRFLREAEMAARLSHPHIVPIYAVDEANGLVWIAMGLVEGESLAQRLHEAPRPTLDVVRRGLRETCDALGGRDQSVEMVMMGLRLLDGISTRRYAALAGAPLSPDAIRELCEEGLLLRAGERIKTTPRGRLLLDGVLARLLG